MQSTFEPRLTIVALVELLASERHGEPLPALVKLCWIVLHCQHPLDAAVEGHSLGTPVQRCFRGLHMHRGGAEGHM